MTISNDHTLSAFIARATEAEVQRVCDAAQVTPGYFGQLAKGRMLPSRKLALRLERISDGRMNAVALLQLQESARALVACEGCAHE